MASNFKLYILFKCLVQVKETDVFATLTIVTFLTEQLQM